MVEQWGMQIEKIIFKGFVKFTKPITILPMENFSLNIQ